MAHKGRYKVKNISKYKDDPSNVIYRSSWELKMFRWLDLNPDITGWQSESIAIPYLSPIDKKIHRYFPDVIFDVMQGGELKTYMIEIKPASQTRPPNPAKRNATPTGRVSTRYLREAAEFAKNDAKWDAARRYCNAKGWTFLVWTEKHLGIK